MPTSYKQKVIEALFNSRWDPITGMLSRSEVTLEDVSVAIQAYNASLPANGRRISTRNPANFFKDIIRREIAFRHWPNSVVQRGFTGRQITGDGMCFEFVPLPVGQTVAFLPWMPKVSSTTPRRVIESASMPLVSRRLGRKDETWLIQVAVHLRLIQTHMAAVSSRNIVQVDHLQTGIKQYRSEIDALYLGTEELGGGTYQEVLLCCEAKPRTETLSEDQLVSEVKAVFGLPRVTQNEVIALGIQVVGKSEIQVIECEGVKRAQAPTLQNLKVLTTEVYKLVPSVPGIE